MYLANTRILLGGLLVFESQSYCFLEIQLYPTV